MTGFVRATDTLTSQMKAIISPIKVFISLMSVFASQTKVIIRLI